MNDKQKRIIKAELKPHCFLLVSGSKRDMKETLGEYRTKPIVSLLYDAGTCAAEWEVEYGPIQIWNKCEATDEGAKEHYFYDFENSSPLSWSQLAVDEYGLPRAFVEGNFDYIFNVLKSWAEDRR